MARVPFLVPLDENGTPVGRFLDCFEYVGGDATGNPQYFRYLHPDGPLCVTEVSDPGTADEHVLFYLELEGGDERLTELWPTRAALPFKGYDKLF